MKCEQTFIILYISMDGGYTYRQKCLCEQTFKRKVWSTICAWLKPDSDMVEGRYSTDIIVRKKDLTHIGTLRVNGNDDIKDYWPQICSLWEQVLDKI